MNRCPEPKSISGLHGKIRRVRGSACIQKCVDCDKYALDWSHIHDTDQFDIWNYEPRCRSCHKKYDLTDSFREKISNSMKGRCHAKAKLDESDVIQIREMYAGGKWSQSDIAYIYGVAQYTISDIVRRVSWSHV